MAAISGGKIWGKEKSARFLFWWTMTEITFGDFAKLASRRGLTPEYLAERFTNKIERLSEFFHRVF